MGRQVIYRPWVVDAVAAWHAKQAPGRSLSPSTAASEVVAHAGIPAAGCGPSIVAALLVKNHGWVHADRMLWRPMFKPQMPQMPQMPMKIASVAPVTMPQMSKIASVDRVDRVDSVDGVDSVDSVVMPNILPPSDLPPYDYDDPNFTI